MYFLAAATAGENTGEVLEPCSTWKCSYSYFQWRGYYRGP